MTWLDYIVCVRAYIYMCACVCAVSGGHAVELQQPGSWQRCVHHWKLWIWLYSCRHGSPLHQGPVQGYAQSHTFRKQYNSKWSPIWHWYAGDDLVIVTSLSTGTLTAVESFLTVGSGPDVCTYISVHWSMVNLQLNHTLLVCVLFCQGGCIHDGTWQSAIYGFADSQKLQSVRRKFNHKPLPTVGSKLRRRYTGQYGLLFLIHHIV